MKRTHDLLGIDEAGCVPHRQLRGVRSKALVAHSSEYPHMTAVFPAKAHMAATEDWFKGFYWSDDGTYVVLEKGHPELRASLVALGMSDRVESFCRQLNFYNFKRKQKTRAAISYWVPPGFVRGCTALLTCVSRTTNNQASKGHTLTQAMTGWLLTYHPAKTSPPIGVWEAEHRLDKMVEDAHAVGGVDDEQLLALSLKLA